FQVPVTRGWSLSLNSGTGTLSYTNIVSTAKQILLDPAFYLTRAFDQGNGGQIQLEGLMSPGLNGLRHIHLRTFSSGGSGRFAGNVGGGYIADERTNFSYNVGTSIQLDHIGYYSVWDTKFLYQQAAQVLSTRFGVKWEQRATERFPALMAGLIFRQGYLHLGAEYYWRQTKQGETVTGQVQEFTSTQHALNAELGVLIWPKHLMLAADYGFYEVLDEEAIGDYPVDEERQLRAALHWYFWGEIGVASLLYVQREIREVSEDEWTQQNELRLAAQYRF
ncbi:MAG: hypothetical protein VYD19_05290, partial [Myxococcota bacterium]|nr:hypothetical protein [Myxococcota bacterium]